MHENASVIKIDADCPQPHIIKSAGRIIQNQGMVIFPAKCLYGIAVDAADPVAVRKIFDVKQRPENNPVLVLIHTESMLAELVTHIPRTAQILMETFWPGNLTLVFNARSHISPLITAGTGKIGIRKPQHPVALALAKQAGIPITGTSANISGQKGCSLVADLPQAIIRTADMVLDAGPLKGGRGSSVVDVSTPDIKMIREGEIPLTAILKALK